MQYAVFFSSDFPHNNDVVVSMPPLHQWFSDDPSLKEIYIAAMKKGVQNLLGRKGYRAVKLTVGLLVGMLDIWFAYYKESIKV